MKCPSLVLGFKSEIKKKIIRMLAANSFFRRIAPVEIVIVFGLSGF